MSTPVPGALGPPKLPLESNNTLLGMMWRIMLQLPEASDDRVTFQSKHAAVLAFMAPDVCSTNTLDEFHWANHLPALFQTYLKISPCGPATAVPEGTLVMFIVVALPVKGS